MFTLSTAGFSRSPSTTESVHQSNNSTNTSNNIQDSLRKLSHSSEELPSRPMYEISLEKRQCIEGNFNTTPPLKNHKIMTNSSKSNVSSNDSFHNKYKANKWTFIYNFRGKKSPVFANEITAYQYEVVAKEKGFYGELPQKIKRKDVINTETLSLTEGKHGEELYNIFFEKTPNGKSTKRIMDNFGLHATAVRRVDKETTYRNTSMVITDFYIDIAPVNSKVTKK
ncbi:hypothetical protein BJP44_06875 [Candidatus Williamhamiltonella defendens]|uniref:Uncharacterized protein n=1 Tax=Hamiltonella defensa subsp. Acyrthosiphon pisum (strain 5AT) TaxID=572265 RepID=C4K6H4_HAMD5|nr:hypothetical protein [Candidatus Hamiltonella defensa]ACQ68167.1 hypothetical protein HDEF_1549 [Candidatus Hamiltonella defensa 5AT (Acyrthosiphon pisum)]ATW22767.1 hypothetical protein BJP44_06875 [Candidatus Hamiltonella defensa]